MKAYVTGWFEIPLRYFTAREVAKLKHELTVTPRTFEGREPKAIKQYKVRKGRLCVPIEWGIKRFPQAKLIDRTAKAEKVVYHKMPSPFHKNAPKGQAEFMEQVKAVVLAHFAALATASTGKGKTVVALWLAAVLQVRILIIVPTTEILNGWLKESKKHVGEIAGVVRQDRCEWRDKKVVVALIHSLACRTYEPGFYEGFGLVVWDEVDVTGAFTFARTLGMFSSMYKLALTATARRKDGAECIFLDYFGPGYAKQHAKALPCLCHPVKFRHEERKLPNQLGIIVSIVAKNKRRNDFLVKWLMWMFRQDRQIVGLSDRIEQLETIRDLLIAAGVPRESIGIVAAQRTIGIAPAYKPAKKVKQGAKYWANSGPLGWADVRVKMRLPKRSLVTLCGEGIRQKGFLMDNKELHTMRMMPVRESVPAAELEAAKDCQVILATYNKFGRGTNVPRLNAGMDLTPRATGEQQIGRIRRFLPDKLLPIWVTVIDVGIPLFEGFAEARIEEYRKCNVTIQRYAKAKR